MRHQPSTILAKKPPTFPLKELIGVPLQAAIDAEIALGKAIHDFVLDWGFEQSEINENIQSPYKFRTITISYDKDGETIVLYVPVLSLITLPLLTIKDAQFDMDIQLKSQVKKLLPPQHVGANDDKIDHEIVGYLPLAGKKYKKRQIANLRLKLNMQEADIPSGLQQLYAHMNESN